MMTRVRHLAAGLARLGNVKKEIKKIVDLAFPDESSSENQNRCLIYVVNTCKNTGNQRRFKAKKTRGQPTWSPLSPPPLKLITV